MSPNITNKHRLSNGQRNLQAPGTSTATNKRDLRRLPSSNSSSSLGVSRPWSCKKATSICWWSPKSSQLPEMYKTMQRVQDVGQENSDIPDPEKSWEYPPVQILCLDFSKPTVKGIHVYLTYLIIFITKQVETCHSSHVSQSDDATLWLVEMTILTKRGTVWRLHPKGKGVIGFVASECSPQKKEYQNIWELRPSILWHLKYRKYKIAMHCGKI